MEGGAQALATGLDSQQDLRNGFHIYIIVLYMVVVVMKYKKSNGELTGQILLRVISATPEIRTGDYEWLLTT